MKLEEFVFERMQENKDLFTEEEWQLIEKNKELTKKIYVIGAINEKFTENNK